MVERSIRTSIMLALGLALGLLLHISAFAQGCVMCKTSAAGSADAAELAFKINLGVLALLVPVVGLFVGIFLMIYRYRDSFGTVEMERDEQLLSLLDPKADSV